MAGLFITRMTSSDNTTTVAELRKLVADFVAERDWSQFHSPKNVSMALAIEAAELMEHFQWLTTEASRELAIGSGEVGRGRRRIGRRDRLFVRAGQRVGAGCFERRAGEDGEERPKVSGRKISRSVREAEDVVA